MFAPMVPRVAATLAMAVLIPPSDNTASAAVDRVLFTAVGVFASSRAAGESSAGYGEVPARVGRGGQGVRIAACPGRECRECNGVSQDGGARGGIRGAAHGQVVIACAGRSARVVDGMCQVQHRSGGAGTNEDIAGGSHRGLERIGLAVDVHWSPATGCPVSVTLNVALAAGVAIFTVRGTAQSRGA